MNESFQKLSHYYLRWHVLIAIENFRFCTFLFLFLNLSFWLHHVAGKILVS